MPTLASSSSRSSSRSRLRAIAAAIGASFASVAPVLAQESADLPAAVASPGDPEAPNDGEWFAVSAEPGETVTMTAQVHNPADQRQAVTLYLSDLSFDGDRPQVGSAGSGVGAWGGFAVPRLDVDARATVPAPFTITVPADADPGDHVGAVVVESQPSAGAASIGVVKRVASRLYVTVPGDARSAVEITDVDVRIESTLVPRRAIVTATVRNAGDVRLEPVVTVNGEPMEGAAVVMSHDTERYVARLPVSILGTRHSFRVAVASATASGTGPSSTATESVWIVPWWIIPAVFIVALLIVAATELRKRVR